jgi:hypothetical protein
MIMKTLSRVGFLMLSLLVSANVQSMTKNTEVIVHKGGFTAPENLGILSVLKDRQNGYSILTKDGAEIVKRQDVSPMLRNMNASQLAAFINQGHGTIQVKRYNNGDFKIEEHVRGNGGAGFGATIGFFAGKFGVSLIGHGAIQAIAFCTGPAYAATVYALEASAGPYIEAASFHAGVVLGVAGMALTGPI